MNTIDKLISNKYSAEQYVATLGTSDIEAQIAELELEKTALIDTLKLIYTDIVNYITAESPTPTKIEDGTVIDSATIRFDDTDHHEPDYRPGKLIHIKFDSPEPDEMIILYVSEPAYFDTYTCLPVSIASEPTDPLPYSTGAADFYTYSDDYILQKEQEWFAICDRLVNVAFANDYDSSYTNYGVVPRLEQLEESLAICESQSASASSSIENLLRFSDWGDGTTSGVTSAAKDPLLDGNITYETDYSFSYPGDITTYTPSGSTILMYCGTDGYVGGEIIESTYYPPSAGDYTLVQLTPDYINYDFITDDIESISYEGTVIVSSGININDDRTTIWLDGDQSSLFTMETAVTLTFADGFTKIAKVRDVKYYDETYDDGDYTYIRLVQYYKLTENLTSIGISTDGTTTTTPISGGILYYDELIFHCSGDQTSTFTEGLSGVWADLGDDGMIPYTVVTSEHMTGDSDYTLVSFSSGDDANGIPITENIEKVYIQPL